MDKATSAKATSEDIIDPMHDWAKDLWPICRSLSGDGVRETLKYFQQLIPELKIRSVASGSEAFDWTVPEEWSIRAATIHGPNGEKIVDFEDNNLHVLGYSEPVNETIPLDELDKHLYSLKDQPDLIPYVTSYYKRRWGFCMAHNQREKLESGDYHVRIDSELFAGELNYGEIIIPGETDQEIFLSSYVCHPSMANNELSGPVVTIALARWIKSLPKRRYTYRIVLIPETIGSIIYLSKNLDELQKNMVAGYVITCVGDERAWSYVESRTGKTLADRVAKYVLEREVESFDTYSFLTRGSDERQYCSPKVDLPVASICRSKYGTYPEYHTSADDLTLVTQKGLSDSFKLYSKCLMVLELDAVYENEYFCEPQLGKRGLYPTISEKGSAKNVRSMMNLIAYADGKNSLIDISEIIGVDIVDCSKIAEELTSAGVLNRIR